MTKQEEINLYGVSNEPTKITNKVMRTEQESLKDFEKLGYYLSSKKEGFLYNGIILSNKNIKGLEIHISFSMKSYAKYDQGLCITITMQEHLLLHELFECWGWI